MKRKCAWRKDLPKGDAKAVWARNGVAVAACPKSVITGESSAFLEEFQARKVFGDFVSLAGLPARTVDAFCVLEQLIVKERSHEQ